MRLKLEDLKRASTGSPLAGLLPVLGWLLVVVLVVALIGGMWAGNRWAEGQHAIKDRAELTTYIRQMRIEVKQLRQMSADDAVNYRQAIARLNDIAKEREIDNEINRKQAAAVRASLDELLRRRPDLRDGRAGDDVLRHWRESNARPTAKPAAADDPAKPAPAVPGPAAAAGRSVGDAAGQPRPGHGAVSRLPKQAVPTDTSGRRVGSDRVGVVLQGAGAGRPGSEGVQR